MESIKIDGKTVAYTINGAAKLFGQSPQWISMMLNRGHLPCIRIGHRRFISADGLVAGFSARAVIDQANAGIR